MPLLHRRSLLSPSTLAQALVVLALAATPVSAQWVDYPTAGVPRKPDGSVDMHAPVPRLPNGKPDLSGIFSVYVINRCLCKCIG